MTATCTNPDCTEYGIPKDLSMMPAGFAPIICGGCGEEIFVDEPAPEAVDR